MKRKNNFSARNIMLIATIICVVMIIFTWETREKVSPIESTFSYVIVPIYNGVNYFGDWIYERVEFVKNINELENMNQELVSELDQLKYENTILQQNEKELSTLRELYELDQTYAEFPKTGAQVIGKDPGNWYNVFLIDKGYNDGLEVNMVVLSGNGLVGYIMEVGPNSAKVQSIINDNCNVNAMVNRTSDTCIVKGDQSLISEKAYTRIEYITDEANIVIGDEIVTSHLSGIYPPGILIGTIKSIEDDPHKMTKTAILEPIVDFKNLDYVLVINELFNEELNEWK